MKYVMMDRGDEISRDLARKFRQLAESYGFREDTESPDVVISIGGDGTMLHAFHRYLKDIGHLKFIGVHTGHLGFFADWQAEEIEELARMMADTNEQALSDRTVQYPLLEIRIDKGKDVETRFALNEFTLKGGKNMLVAGLNINDEEFEVFRGDGICVSTPTGSTAYNKSLGGAIIHPSLESIQIAEIASINNRVYRTLGSSLILPKHHHCDIVPRERQSMILSIDHLQFEMDNIASIRCSVASQKVQFARLRPFPFWSRVREAFIGRQRDS